MRNTAITAVITAAMLLMITAITAHAQIISVNTPINITAVSTNNTIVGSYVYVALDPIPINSTAVNVTITAYNFLNMRPASVTVYLNVVNYYTNSSTVYVYASYAVNVTGVGYEVVKWPTNATGIAWNVEINNTYYPSYDTYFYLPVTVPIITPPSPIATLASFIGLAIFVALAGRHKLREAGLGSVVYGVMITPALTMLGLATPSTYVLSAISVMFGIIMIMLGRKLEEP